MSILRRASLALLVVPGLALACSDTPTSPSIESADVGPSLAVASLSPITAQEGRPQAFFCGTSTDAEGDALLCRWDFGNDGLYEAQCSTADAICRWDFDHNGIFEGQRTGSFDYAWPDNGSYPVGLHVSDASGQASSIVVTATVSNVAPIIVFYRDNIVVNVGQSTRYNTRFEDPGLADAPWTFTFDFGDGTVIGPRSITAPDAIGQYHAYAAVGSYTVTVVITDKDGGSVTLVRTATVINNQKPVANIGGPYTGVEGSSVQFSSAGTVDDQTTLTYSWDFGDGSRSTLPNPTRRYLDNGVYNVRMIVADPTGAADTAFTTATISNANPDGAPRVPVSAREGTAYSLAMTSHDPGTADTPTLQFQFDCGQGAGLTAWSRSTSVQCPALPDQGTVTTILRARDKDGGFTEYVRTISVTNMPPVVTFTPTSATTIPVGGSLSVAGTFVDPGLADGPFRYAIGWGDGTAQTTGTAPANVTTPPLTASHTYTRAGTFNVYLFVTDKDGALRRSSVITVTVTVTP